MRIGPFLFYTCEHTALLLLRIPVRTADLVLIVFIRARGVDQRQCVVGESVALAGGRSQAIHQDGRHFFSVEHRPCGGRHLIPIIVWLVPVLVATPAPRSVPQRCHQVRQAHDVQRVLRNETGQFRRGGIRRRWGIPQRNASLSD